MGLLPLVFPTLTCPESCPGLFTRRSPPRLFTAAARAGLRSAPESRSRGAYPHLLRSFTTRTSLHLLLLPCFCSTHRVAVSSFWGQTRLFGGPPAILSTRAKCQMRSLTSPLARTSIRLTAEG